AVIVLSRAAEAQSPWENAVNVLQLSFTGPIARGLSLISIVVGGITFAFGEGQSKRLLAGIVFGVGMAIGAVNFMAWLFPLPSDPIHAAHVPSGISLDEQAVDNLGSGTAALLRCARHRRRNVQFFRRAADRRAGVFRALSWSALCDGDRPAAATNSAQLRGAHCPVRPCQAHVLQAHGPAAAKRGNGMIKVARILRQFSDTGALNELLNLYGFIDEQMFLTKSGSVGLVLRVTGIDDEGMDVARCEQV